MRSIVRKSLATSAVLASSIAAVAFGTAGSAQAAPGGPSSSPLTISDGTANVTVGSRTVHFGGAVTDAAWSPDGARVAYIDGNGQLATAAADGTDVMVLTGSSATKSHPTWEDGGSEIIFAETVNGVSHLMSVDANGLTLGKTTVETPVAETQNDSGSDALPDAVFRTYDPANPSTPMLNKLVFQNEDAQGDHVMILDRNTRGPRGVKLTDGSSPSIAPDGHAVAFVDAAGQIETVALPMTFDSQGQPTPVFSKVTSVATPAFSHLTWSPDSKTIAAEGAKDVETVPADGSSAPTVVRDTPGVPAYQPLNKKEVDRVAGGDRIGTAIAASQSTWATAGATGVNHAVSVVLSRADQFADALGGSALANHQDGPLLLTETSGLDSAVKAEIVRVLGAPNPQYTQTVYLLGGEQALSPAVYTAAKALGYNVERIGGADRYATSIAIADKMTGGRAPGKTFVATGMNFADALSAGAAASLGNGSGVVVLTDDKAMPAATAAYLNRSAHNGSPGSVPVFAVGGQADAALRSIGFGTGGAKQFTPVWGVDRYATSLLVAQDFFDGPSKVGFATGLNWADALSGGALMGRLNGPLVLTDPTAGPSTDTVTWLRHSAPQLTRALVFGGKAAVAPSVDSTVGAAISGPAGFTTGTNPTGLSNY
jgi:Tol biopolymer transport system component